MSLLKYKLINKKLQSYKQRRFLLASLKNQLGVHQNVLPKLVVFSTMVGVSFIDVNKQ